MKKSECFYCKIDHERVEAEGIYYCPNPLCRGPGAAWFRRTLESYHEILDGRHTVDEKELKEKASKYLEENPL